MKRKLSDLPKLLIGPASSFDMEGRIFHSVCILALIMLGLNIPFNYWIGLTKVSAVLMVIFAALLFIYYNSRFRNGQRASIICFQLFNAVLVVANYYYNDGINGPGIAAFLLSFFITVAIVPSRQYIIWLPLNILLLLGMLWAEYTYPHWIENIYNERSSRFLDFSFSYLMAAALIFLVTAYIRNAYHLEHVNVARKATDLEASNHTKNKLLSILAHDLKEPLNSIQGFLELITEYNLDEAEKQAIEKDLLRRTKDTSYLLANVLSWTKGQMDEVQPELVELDLQRALEPAINLLAPIAKEKGIELEHSLEAGCMIIADPDMIQLVTRNLIMNAIKFTYPGGKISVAAGTADGNCMIQVSDTGQGIPVARQASLFSIQAKSTFGTGKEKGAGLGLVLCKEFIELQGGSIGFSSEPGKGSTFYLTLALSRPHTGKALQTAEV